MDGSLSSALAKLANYRTNNTRASEQVVESGQIVLNKKGGLRKLGDQAWPFLEQLALAAIDTGRLDLADDCISKLSTQFPDSPRLECLQGIRFEASEPPERCLEYYDALLQADESNAAAWKRKISVLRSIHQSTNPKEPIDQLLEYLDTFYADVEAWLELADIYSTYNQYTFALHALSHAMLLAPQNPFYVLQSAQVAFDSGDINLSLRFFLRAVEMASEDLGPADDRGGGEDKASLRGWYGVKLCTKTLLDTSTSSQRLQQVSRTESQAQPLTDQHLRLVDELATERLLALYSGETPGRTELLTWLQSSSR